MEINQVTTPRNKNMGTMRLTNGSARCIWMFRFKTKEDCIKAIWGVMNNKDLISPTLSWHNKNRRMIHYSKEEAPGGKMGDEKYFSDRLGLCEDEKYVIRADNADHVFIGKKERTRRMCFIWYTRNEGKYLFLSMGGKEEVSEAENRVIRKLAGESDGWLRKKIA